MRHLAMLGLLLSAATCGNKGGPSAASIDWSPAFEERSRAFAALDGASGLIAQCDDPALAAARDASIARMGAARDAIDASGVPASSQALREGQNALDEARQIATDCDLLAPGAPGNPGWQATWWLISS